MCLLLIDRNLGLKHLALQNELSGVRSGELAGQAKGPLNQSAQDNHRHPSN